MSTVRIPDALRDVLDAHPEKMSGLPCFRGTRIPVTLLLDNVRAGVSVAEFRESYPDVEPESVRRVLDWGDAQARRALGLGATAV